MCPGMESEGSPPPPPTYLYGGRCHNTRRATTKREQLVVVALVSQVERQNWVKVEAVNAKGKKIKKKYTDWTARIFQARPFLFAAPGLLQRFKWFSATPFISPT